MFYTGCAASNYYTQNGLSQYPLKESYSDNEIQSNVYWLDIFKIFHKSLFFLKIIDEQKLNLPHSPFGMLYTVLHFLKRICRASWADVACS